MPSYHGHIEGTPHVFCGSSGQLQHTAAYGFAECDTLPFDQFGSKTIPPATNRDPAARITYFDHHSSLSEGSVDSGYELSTSRSGSEDPSSSLSTSDSNLYAQTRRKAQNRAAQRAFRERKERHVRELEEKLASLEVTLSQLRNDNSQLRMALQRANSDSSVRTTQPACCVTPPQDSSPATRPRIWNSPPIGFINPHETPAADYQDLNTQRPLLPPSSISLDSGLYTLSTPSQQSQCIQTPPSTHIQSHTYIPDDVSTISNSSRYMSFQDTWEYISAVSLRHGNTVDLRAVFERLEALALAQERAGQAEPVFGEADVSNILQDALLQTDQYMTAPVGEAAHQVLGSAGWSDGH